jgi:hypothetical protein
MTSKKSRIESAKWYAALGHHRRLFICEILHAHHNIGLRFDTLSFQSRMSPSTLTHHLMHMDRAGLLTRKTKGRETWISLNLPKLAAAPA